MQIEGNVKDTSTCMQSGRHVIDGAKSGRKKEK